MTLAPNVRGGGRGYQNGGPLFANLSPRLSLFSDHLRTVLAVKGSLRRAQQPRALDGSGPFRTTLLRRGKGSPRMAPLSGDHFAAILVPFRRHRQKRRRNAQNSSRRLTRDSENAFQPNGPCQTSVRIADDTFRTRPHTSLTPPALSPLWPQPPDRPARS